MRLQKSCHHQPNDPPVPQRPYTKLQNSCHHRPDDPLRTDFCSFMYRNPKTGQPIGPAQNPPLAHNIAKIG